MKIQDYGLKKITLILIFWNVLLGIHAFYHTKDFFSPNLFILLLSSIFLLSTKYIVSRGKSALFTALGIMLLSLMWFDYEFIGLYAQKSNLFTLQDPIIYSFEKNLFERPLGQILEGWIMKTGPLSMLLMDFFMLCYVTYFALPFYHILIIYLEKTEQDHPVIGNFVFSFILLFVLNFTFYMIVPVTGPHYYFKEFYSSPLHFSIFGQRIHNLIVSLQPNFIDCFPSGHSAVAYLIIFWNIKLQLTQKKVAIFISLMIILSTLILRFHYLLDVLAAVILVFFALLLSGSLGGRKKYLS